MDERGLKMALDHYIPQVYLRRFNSADGIDSFYAIKRADGKTFKTKSKDVCRIEDYTTNSYFEDERIIEEFLQTIEPNINKAINSFSDKKYDVETIYTLSGLVAFIASCSPSAIRFATTMVQSNVEDMAKILDKQGKLPKLNHDGKELILSEMLKNGNVRLNIDDKYCQSLGISNVMKIQASFGNSPWEILINETSDYYITGDYPIAIEKTNDPRIVNKIFPITPRIAIRICPDINVCDDEKDFVLNPFRYREINVGRSDVKYINKQLIIAAENMVFMKKYDSMIYSWVLKYKRKRIAQKMYKFPTQNGYYSVGRMEVETRNK